MGSLSEEEHRFFDAYEDIASISDAKSDSYLILILVLTTLFRLVFTMNYGLRALEVFRSSGVSSLIGWELV
jgi:hypothetical protein